MTEEILERARSDDADTRQRAASELGKSGSPDSLPLMFEMIGDQDWRVRKTVVDGLLNQDLSLVIPRLIEALRDGTNAGRRNSATEALIRIGKPAIPPILTALAAEQDADVRLSLINLLGELRSEEGYEALLEVLRTEEDVNIASGAAAAIGNYERSGAIPLLIKALDRGDPWLDFHVIEALGVIGDRSALPAILPRYSEKSLRKAVLNAVAKIADVGTVNFLVRIIRDEERLNLQALQTLVRIADAEKPRLMKDAELQLIRRKVRGAFVSEHLAALIDHLRGTSKRDVRVFILRILGWSGARSVVPVLIEHLSDPDLSEAAANALVEFGEEALAPIYAALRSAEDDDGILVLMRVANAIGGPDIVPAVTPYLDHPTAEIRRLSVEIIGERGSGKETDYLVTRLDDEDPGVQQAAVEALERQVGLHPEARDRVLSRVSKLLSSESVAERINALQVIVDTEGEGYHDELLRAAHHPEATIRQKAIALMGRFSEERFAQTMTLALADEATPVRLAAIQAIVRMQPDEGLTPLISALRDNDIWIRTAAAQALGEYRAEEAIEPLIEQIEAPVPPVRIAAIEALGKFRTDRVRAPLLGMLDAGDPEVEKAALVALARVDGDDVLEAIVRELGSADWRKRAAAAQALGIRGDDAALESLHALFYRETDPYVRQSIAEALVTLSNPSSFDCLLEALRDETLVDEVSLMLARSGERWKGALESAWKKADSRIEPVIAAILGAIRGAARGD